MYLVNFKKIKNNHNRLRTDEVQGLAQKLPQVGECFVIVGKGLEFGNRCVNTSPLKEVKKTEKGYELHTESGSIYEVEMLGVVND